jgi:hypothetical protein
MRCVQNKWGAGSCSERPVDSVGATAMKKSLDIMLAERAKQDQKWSNGGAGAPVTYTSAEQTHQSQLSSSSERGRYAASSR